MPKPTVPYVSVQCPECANVFKASVLPDNKLKIRHHVKRRGAIVDVCPGAGRIVDDPRATT